MPPASVATGPPLVVLAAGLGSRYGGVKQLAGFGPGGEPLLQFALDDAARAGFSRAVLVIRPEMETDVRDLAEARLSRVLPVTLAFQRLELDDPPSLPARQKPWGTAHAVLAVQGPGRSTTSAVLTTPVKVAVGALVVLCVAAQDVPIAPPPL